MTADDGSAKPTRVSGLRPKPRGSYGAEPIPSVSCKASPCRRSYCAPARCFFCFGSESAVPLLRMLPHGSRLTFLSGNFFKELW